MGSSNWEGFLECWKDFASRTDRPECTLDYLKKSEGYIRPKTAKHLLSIGPGTGEIDYALMSLLPHLTSYTAVEPDVGALATVKGRLEEFTAIKKHYVNGLMETYTGPQCGTDIILMSHCCYHFADSFSQQVGCALSWLNKEGGRILLFHDQDTFSEFLASVVDIPKNNYDLILDRLVSMGVNFTEAAIDYTLDLTYPGPSYYGFLSVFLNRRATKEEVDKAMTLLRSVSIPGTEKVAITQSLFVIESTPNTLDEK